MMATRGGNNCKIHFAGLIVLKYDTEVNHQDLFFLDIALQNSCFEHFAVKF